MPRAHHQPTDPLVPELPDKQIQKWPAPHRRERLWRRRNNSSQASSQTTNEQNGFDFVFVPHQTGLPLESRGGNCRTALTIQSSL
jgi:hypothetical protein